MNVMHVWQFTLSIFGTFFLYAPFPEYILHRWVMHSHNPLCKTPYNRHTLTHHIERKYGEFFAQEKYRFGVSSAIPLMWGGHAPFFFGIGYITTAWVGWGIAIGALVYIMAYELSHHAIHVPCGYKFQRTRFFQNLVKRHHIHHVKHRLNYNVVCPLADWIFGTLCLEDPWREQSAPPEYTFLAIK